LTDARRVSFGQAVPFAIRQNASGADDLTAR
jgi:hypothetical protein